MIMNDAVSGLEHEFFPAPDGDPRWDARSRPAPPRAGRRAASSREPVVPSDDEVIARIRDHHRGRRLPPPATPETVASAEALVRYPMPPLLRRIYLEVADGRFDDRAGVLPLSDAVIRSNGTVNRRHLLDDIPEVCLRGPAGVVPLRFWGRSAWTHVDWRTPEGRLWGEDEGRVHPEKFTLAEQLVRWTEPSPPPPTGRGPTPGP